MNTLLADSAVFLADKELFNRQRRIREEVITLFTACAAPLQAAVEQRDLPLEIAAIQPKISRGENYLGYPWQILDFPRYFTGEAVFAHRLMCWWGHSFISTFHISGTWLHRYETEIFNRLADLNGKHVLLGYNADQWVHHTGEDNYLPLEEISIDFDSYRAAVNNRGFFKCCRIIEFSSKTSLSDAAEEALNLWLDLCGCERR